MLYIVLLTNEHDSIHAVNIICTQLHLHQLIFIDHNYSNSINNFPFKFIVTRNFSPLSSVLTGKLFKCFMKFHAVAHFFFSWKLSYSSLLSVFPRFIVAWKQFKLNFISFCTYYTALSSSVFQYINEIFAYKMKCISIRSLWCSIYKKWIYFIEENLLL